MRPIDEESVVVKADAVFAGHKFRDVVLIDSTFSNSNCFYLLEMSL